MSRAIHHRRLAYTFQPVTDPLTRRQLTDALSRARFALP